MSGPAGVSRGRLALPGQTCTVAGSEPAGPLHHRRILVTGGCMFGADRLTDNGSTMGRAGQTNPPATVAVVEAVSTMAGRFAELVESAPNPDMAVPATPDWSVTDVFGHVAMEPSRYRELALGRGDWPSRVVDLPAFNAAQIRSLPTRDVAELAATLRADTDALLATASGFGEDPPLMNFDGDQRVRADRALGTLLGEYVVHGHDIARALGRPWPIDPAHVPMIMEGLHQVLPGWVNPANAAGHNATYEMRLRGYARYVYQFRNGQLTVNPPEPGRIDVHIVADPITALLLNYGRISQWKPALTGRVFAWGRRPWLGVGFARRFHPA